MPQTTAQLNTALTAQSTQQVAVPTGSTEGVTVHVDLVFQTSFVPVNLLTALKNQYGAAKVLSDKDTNEHNNYQFRIIP